MWFNWWERGYTVLQTRCTTLGNRLILKVILASIEQQDSACENIAELRVGAVLERESVNQSCKRFAY